MPFEIAESLVAEQNSDASIAVNIPGRYSLADLRDAHGERRVFGCRAVSLSAHTLAIAAPKLGKTSARVIADILHVGRLSGFIERVFDRGFAMTIKASDGERERLVDRIAWLAKHKDHEVPDKRAGHRFMPAKPYSRITMVDRTVLTCVIIDLSTSGAALSAEIDPEIGTLVMVGKIVGQVVRHFRGGFSVRFLKQPSPKNVEAMATYDS